MDISTLRVAADDENDAVSESNLSDVLVVDEYPEVELAKTEHILEKMGTSSSPGVIELCDDIVLMLNPVNSSTPKRSSSSGSTSSSATHSSMPSLGDGWSGNSDSGNATENSDAPSTQAGTASDTVKVIYEDWQLFIDIVTMINILCSRTPPPHHRSELRDKLMSDLSAMCILHKSFIIYYLTRQPSLTNVLHISGAAMLRKSLLLR